MDTRRSAAHHCDLWEPGCRLGRAWRARKRAAFCTAAARYAHSSRLVQRDTRVSDGTLRGRGRYSKRATRRTLRVAAAMSVGRALARCSTLPGLGGVGWLYPRLGMAPRANPWRIARAGAKRSPERSVSKCLDAMLNPDHWADRSQASASACSERCCHTTVTFRGCNTQDTRDKAQPCKSAS